MDEFAYLRSGQFLFSFVYNTRAHQQAGYRADENQGHTPHNYNIYFPHQKTCGVWFIVIFKNNATIPMSNAKRPQIPPNSFLVPLPFCDIYSVDGNIFGGKVPSPFPLSLRAAAPIARISSSSVVSPCSSELSGCLARGTTEPSLRKNT